MITKFAMIGSDAGWWSFEDGHWVHHGGWEVEAIADVVTAVSMISQAPQLKTPGLANESTQGLVEFVNRELGAHINADNKEVVVVIVNAPAR
jgi:hypothetical protein